MTLKIEISNPYIRKIKGGLLTVVCYINNKSLEVKKFQPILGITKPATRNSYKPIANQVLQNQNQLRVTKLLLLSLSLFEDKQIKNSIALSDSSNYGIKSILFSG